MRNTIIAILLAFYAGPFAFAQPERPKTVRDAPSTEQLGKLLKEQGFDPQALTPQVWQVSINRDQWKVHVMVSLTPDGEQIWLESKFAKVTNPELAPASAWLKLLEANERVRPAHFTFDKTDHRITLYRAFDNIGLTAARLKKELESFDAAARKTQNVWRSENFSPPEEIPVLPRSKEEAPKKDAKPDGTSKLDGIWRIVRFETKGESITAEKLASRQWSMIVAGDKATVKTGLAPERTVNVRLDPTQHPKTIDFVDSSARVEEGIYIVETGLLTVCFAGKGEARPRQFVTDPKNKFWLLVLKREE